jgi:hypothetical protein
MSSDTTEPTNDLGLELLLLEAALQGYDAAKNRSRPERQNRGTAATEAPKMGGAGSEGQGDRFLRSSPDGATPAACPDSATLWRRLFAGKRYDAHLTRLNERRKVCGQPLLDQSVEQTVKHRRAGRLIHLGHALVVVALHLVLGNVPVVVVGHALRRQIRHILRAHVVAESHKAEPVGDRETVKVCLSQTWSQQSLWDLQ